MIEPFLFVDGWKIYCNNGNRTFINKKDLKLAKSKGMSEDDIKIMAYNYLAEPNVVEDIFMTKQNFKNEF